MVYRNGATKHRTDKTVTSTPPRSNATIHFCTTMTSARGAHWSDLRAPVPFYGESHALGLEDSVLLSCEVSPLPWRFHLVAFHRLILLRCLVDVWQREKCCLSSVGYRVM